MQQSPTDLALSAGDQASLDASLADINDNLSNYWATPFVTIGLGYKF